jgi:hypothetical protein
MLHGSTVRRSTAITLVACLTLALTSSAAAAARPSGFVRACGAIKADGRHLRVDIGEGDGNVVTCTHARGVMRRFLHTRDSDFRMFGRKWGCYKSRPDGQGWDYHCNSGTRTYVDVAAGRRW